MTSSHLSAVRSAIIAAVPSILGNWSGCPVCNMMCDACEVGPKSARKIGIADVFLAMEVKHTAYAVEQEGFFMRYESGGTEWEGCDSVMWDLTDDNLDHQSPECLDFLYKILCV